MNDEYEKISQREHILLKSEMYVGNNKQSNSLEWIINDENIFEKREISYTYALLKIFDEIISNAQDEVLKKNNVTYIDINIDFTHNYISVCNDGKGIPIEKFKDTEDYIPTVLFGQFLTSSNYKNNDKTWIGNFGFGAKLTNVFSKTFIVEIYNKQSKLLFTQTWKKNMEKMSVPIIKNDEEYENDYTKITFKPDLEKLDTESLNSDIRHVFIKRIHDLAGNININVILNDELIYYKNFKSYISSYPFQLPIIYDENNEYKCGVLISENGGDQISFVNGNITVLGGTHVNYFINQIIKYVKPILEKKKISNLKSNTVKSHIIIFLSCKVINPKFNSQTKNQLISAYNTTISDYFLKKISSSELVDILINNENSKIDNKLLKSQGKKLNKITGIPKLEDANFAGTKQSEKCTLILTEGDSAKSLAIAGLSIIGRDYYGVFPLKGKLLNVKDASKKQILQNQEINNIIKIMGLKYNIKYTSLKNLRYGKIMLMTDQDQDGSHIKGLVINFIQTFWPELLKLNIIEEFITPIIKCTRKSKTISFYNLKEYNSWKNNNNNNNKYIIKYYKGLGTSTSAEIKEYFKDIYKHKYYFVYNKDDDNQINKAFSKDCINLRKKWLEDFMNNLSEDAILYNINDNNRYITYTDFINKELIYFSNADNIRSIPNIIDGLKPGQRKILHVLFELPDKEIKVEQLGGIVSSKTAYHHGEQSLKLTIINLAHNYVGSNNINLLEPIGQFGTRLLGGKDSASPRYIYTKLSPITKYIFKEEDSNILEYLVEENIKIEPKFYIPIIPLILINGARGIGTGWATNIPCYNLLDIIEELEFMIKNNSESKRIFKPWYRNFDGYIFETNIKYSYIMQGKLYINPKEFKVIIYELPIGMWTQTYKEKYISDNKDIKDFQEYHTEETVKFILTLEESVFNSLLEKENGFLTYFKLLIKIKTNDLVSFNSDYKLHIYENVNKIMNEFYKIRMDTYAKRKEYLLKNLQEILEMLKNKIRFIKEICDRKIVIERKSKEYIIKLLEERNYDKLPNYDYLLQLPIYSLTEEKIQEYENKYSDIKNKYKTLYEMSLENIWLTELEDLKTFYKKNNVNISNNIDVSNNINYKEQIVT